MGVRKSRDTLCRWLGLSCGRQPNRLANLTSFTWIQIRSWSIVTDISTSKKWAVVEYSMGFGQRVDTEACTFTVPVPSSWINDRQFRECLKDLSSSLMENGRAKHGAE